MTTAQLPSGATMVNTTKVLQQVTDYYLTKRKIMFSRCLPLAALASAARAKQRPGVYQSQAVV
ncbi:hypothetical protein SFA33_10530 [Escherichia coli]|nr:hypothetical protein [Escherichia coli]